MGSENLSSFIGKTDQVEEKGAQKISVNGLERQKGSDCLVVDIERFASSNLFTDKDRNANSRITLQRSLSRKGSQQQQGAENKPNLVTNNERDIASLAISPRGSLLHGGGTPEKPMVVVVGATDHHSHNCQVLNPITIITGAATVAESKGGAATITRRSSIKRSSTSPWYFDPKKILFLFATVSSIGTIILICCTLCMNKLNGDENGFI